MMRKDSGSNSVEDDRGDRELGDKGLISGFRLDNLGQPGGTWADGGNHGRRGTHGSPDHSRMTQDARRLGCPSHRPPHCDDRWDGWCIQSTGDGQRDQSRQNAQEVRQRMARPIAGPTKGSRHGSGHPFSEETKGEVVDFSSFVSGIEDLMRWAEATESEHPRSKGVKYRGGVLVDPGIGSIVNKLPPNEGY